jgi:hypothetical protein
VAILQLTSTQILAANRGLLIATMLLAMLQEEVKISAMLLRAAVQTETRLNGMSQIL